MKLMRILQLVSSKVTHPTGDPKFSVLQAFPAGINEVDADPFLMCDHFGPTVSPGPNPDPDFFPVGWHPHRGQDILSYLVEGIGRHADSLGNRGTFPSPGMQWISVGSGIEHAEGFETPKGETTQGFQIWVNVPSARKMDDPRYGTEPPENIPTIEADGVTARLLAGPLVDPSKGSVAEGPFRTVQEVQILDLSLSAGSRYTYLLPSGFNTCIFYIASGSGELSSTAVASGKVALLDTSSGDGAELSSSAGMRIMVFAGVKLKQPIAWQGPFVMTTEKEIETTIREYRGGTFLKKRASWDYKKAAAVPKDLQGSQCL
jgi:quercetin 2,3-dioxygenase